MSATMGSAVRTRAGAYGLVDIVFLASLVLYPANAALSIGILGEARSEPYVILNLVAAPVVVISLLSRRLARASPVINVFAILFLLAVILSIVANIDLIASNEVRGRSGFDRLVTSTLVPVFGIYFAYLVFWYASASLRDFILLPLVAGAVLTAAIGVFEVASWNLDAVRAVFLPLSEILHAITRRGSAVPGRVQSLTYEASNFGMYAIFTLPVLIAAFFRSDLHAYRGWIAAAFVTLVALAFLSGRTAVFGSVFVLVVMLAAFAALNARATSAFRFALFGMGAAFIAVSAGPVVVLMLFEGEVVRAATESDSVSNLSRLGTMVVQLRQFSISPLFGVGMGQYPFTVQELIPAWALTWEFEAWMVEASASFFPSFSIFTRLAAELGGFGYLAWVVFWLALTLGVVAAARRHRLATGLVPWFGVALVAGSFGIVFDGWNIASYRVPYIWLLLGLSAAYLRDAGAMEGTGRRVRLPMPDGAGAHAAQGRA